MRNAKGSKITVRAEDEAQAREVFDHLAKRHGVTHDKDQAPGKVTLTYPETYLSVPIQDALLNFKGANAHVYYD